MQLEELEKKGVPVAGGAEACSAPPPSHPCGARNGYPSCFGSSGSRG